MGRAGAILSVRIWLSAKSILFQPHKGSSVTAARAATVTTTALQSHKGSSVTVHSYMTLTDAALQSHKGSSVTGPRVRCVISISASIPQGFVCNATRRSAAVIGLRLQSHKGSSVTRPVVKWAREHGLQSHKGSPVTHRSQAAPLREYRLQSHKGSSVTIGENHPEWSNRSASIPQDWSSDQE